jgi:arylsulfatase A
VSSKICFFNLIFAFLVAFLWCAPTGVGAVSPKAGHPATGTERQPNFVVIFIDDMGYGDIGPFGSSINQTPELDRMAAEGMKLTSFYVPAPVCTPSRAGLMTGCYPRRVGLATGSWRIVLFPKDSHGLNPEEMTIAEMLKEAGYATGCFGKWHLGDQPEFLPTNHGFDTYYGIPYSNDMWPPHKPSASWKNGVCPLPILRDTEVVEIVEDMDDQADLCRKFTEAAVAFIRENRDRPFFCYLPHAFVHMPRKARPQFMEQASSGGGKKAHEAQVEELDWSTGEILKTLRELGIAEKTLVIFTSDNGPAGGSAGPLRGHKGTTWEGGMREPTLAWWPGTVPAGAVCDEIGSVMDFLPTFAALSGAKAPAGRTIDGEDISPLLLGRAGAKTPHEAFYYHKGNRLDAVRSGPWKLFASGELYHLEQDIGEQTDVASEHPEVVARLQTLMADFDQELKANSRPVGKAEQTRYLVPDGTEPDGEERSNPARKVGS